MQSKAKRKTDNTLWSSQTVCHPGTSQALRRLTTEAGRDPVRSSRYGSQRGLATLFQRWVLLPRASAQRTGAIGALLCATNLSATCAWRAHTRIATATTVWHESRRWRTPINTPTVPAATTTLAIIAHRTRVPRTARATVRRHSHGRLSVCSSFGQLGTANGVAWRGRNWQYYKALAAGGNT